MLHIIHVKELLKVPFYGIKPAIDGLKFGRFSKDQTNFNQTMASLTPITRMKILKYSAGRLADADL